MCITKGDLEDIKKALNDLRVEIKGMKIKYDEVYEYMEANQSEKWERFAQKIQKQMNDFVREFKGE